MKNLSGVRQRLSSLLAAQEAEPYFNPNMKDLSGENLHRVVSEDAVGLGLLVAGNITCDSGILLPTLNGCNHVLFHISFIALRFVALCSAFCISRLIGISACADGCWAIQSCTFFQNRGLLGQGNVWAAMSSTSIGFL